MIKLKNATFLATQNFKVRKRRLIISCLTAAILFAVITAAIISSQIFLRDLAQLNDQIFDGRIYLHARLNEHNEIPKNDIEKYNGKILNSKTISSPINEETFEPEFALEEKHERNLNISNLELLDDKALEKLKIANQKNKSAIPIYISSVSATKISQKENYKDMIAEIKNKTFLAKNGSEEIVFEIIGIIPENDMTKVGAKNLFEMVSGNDGTSFAIEGAVVPFSEESRLIRLGYSNDNSGSSTLLLEFKDSSSAYEFAKNHTCLAGTGFENCDSSSLFAKEFVTKTVSISNFKQGFDVFIFWATAFFSFISCLILAGTFSKIFIDEQKTSAIYQTVGARRFDIFRIYLIFTLVLGIISAIITLILGFGFSAIVQFGQSAEVSQAAANYFLIENTNLNFIGFTAFSLIPPAILILASLVSLFLNLDKISSKNIIQTLKD